MTERLLDLMEKMNVWQAEISSQDIFAFSMDIDWASETAIEVALDFFINNNIPLTIFCTHPSEILDKYKSNPLINLGIHPNFLPDSSQGKTHAEIADYLFSIVPDAIAMRCHRWFSDNDIYELLVPRGILFDSNEISLMDIMPPHLHRSGILSFPVCWEDGAYLWHNFSLDFKSIGSKIFGRKGMKVINCHPMHFAINTPFFTWTRSIKDKLTREQYVSLDKDDLAKIEFKGQGLRNFVMDMVNFAIAGKSRCVLLSEIYQQSPVSKTHLFFPDKKA